MKFPSEVLSVIKKYFLENKINKFKTSKFIFELKTINKLLVFKKCLFKWSSKYKVLIISLRSFYHIIEVLQVLFPYITNPSKTLSGENIPSNEKRVLSEIQVMLFSS